MKRIKTFIVVAGLFILFSVACTKENDLVSTSEASQFAEATFHYIGEQFGGGIIFYIDSFGRHGLIAATADLEEPAVWSYNNNITNATGTRIGTGYKNTSKIIKTEGNPGDQAEGYAALEIAGFTINAYYDWYLPAKGELNELFKQKEVVGGFRPFAYWSSTEVNASMAWFQNFSSGLQVKSPKIYSYALRPVRAF